jgi:uncharacterized membrane protein
LPDLETDSWFIATLIMVVTAATAFIIQRAITPLFTLAFEICVFYVPALVLSIIYLHKRGTVKEARGRRLP